VPSVNQHKIVSGRLRWSARNARWLSGCAACVLKMFLASHAVAAEGLPVTLSGAAGLIDMPSARMAPDGELSFSAAFFENTQRYSLNFQALPWLETSFRYSGLTDFQPAYPVYFDRAFGVKVRLWDENGFWPAVAVGTNDLVGTGVYSGEYVVASKQVGPVDFTLGMGWGRLATANTIRNPLTLLSDRFETRAENDVGLGGNFSFGRYFHGPNAGLFGGVSWKTPVTGLTVIAEYSSDSYQDERKVGTFTPRNQFNFGASYRLYDNIALGLGWIYGRSVYGSLALSINPIANPFPQRLGPALPAPGIRSGEKQARSLQTAKTRRDNNADGSVDERLADMLWAAADVHNVSINGQTISLTVPRPAAGLCGTMARQIATYAGDLRTLRINENSCAIPNLTPLRAVAQAETLMRPMVLAEPVTINAAGPARPSRAQAEASIRRKIQEQNINLLAMSLSGSEALVYYQNNYYFEEGEAIDRLVRILMADAPGEIESFRFLPVMGGVPQAQIVIPRGTAERSFSQQGSYRIFNDQGSYLPPPMSNPLLSSAQRESYPRFSWSAYPQLRQQLFDPNNPFGVQLVIGADAAVDLLPGLRLLAQVDGNVANTFDVSRASDSVLPHVRTDFVNYFSKGKSGIGALMFEQNLRLSPNTLAAIRVGYLESMFAGIGGEILWQPEGARWALGGNLYYVQQRQFNRLFGLQAYTQTTGHVSFYYRAPWYDIDVQFRVGRYLAGDWGATMHVSRRFRSGIEAGVFATKTNVSAAQFGEGSFDKGIMIRIPLSAIMPVHTQQSYDLALRPVQRDGGQMLSGDAMLYERARRTSEGDLRNFN
jgi:hypothetical protein